MLAPRPLLLCSLLLLTACPSEEAGGGDPDGGGGADNGKVASIVVTPSAATLNLGGEFTFLAEAFDETGNPLTDVTFTWESVLPTYASVTGGQVTGLAVGGTAITAKIGRVSSNSATVLVMPAPKPTDPSSDEVLEQAKSAGLINDEELLMYRVFAAFNDPRLPLQYRGNGVGGFESDVLDELNEKFDGLTLKTQNALAMYLMRPADKGSWLNTPVPDTGLDEGRPSCRGESAGWTTINPSYAKVNVWYDFRVPGQKEKAQAVSDAIEKEIWPKLIDGVGFPEPLSDVSVLGCYGGDKRLDVYLVRNLKDRANTPSQGLNFYQAPTYILLRASMTADEMQGAVAHEMMHSIQWATKMASFQHSYGWIRDAMANWAIDHVFGMTHQVEQDYADCHMNSTEVSLDDRSKGHCVAMGGDVRRDYGAYLFFQHIARTQSPATVKAILAGLTTANTGVEAVNANISGGFKDQWPKFGKALWNQAPVDTKPGFKMWDALREVVQPYDETGDLGSAPELKTVLPSEIKDLSNFYLRFTFNDHEARSVLFYNGWFDQAKAGKAVKVLALWKDAAGTWQDEDWTDYEFVGLCRDIKNQRAKELLIIVSNGEFTPGGGGKLTAAKAPYLKRNNMACYKAKGTGRYDETHSSWTGPGRVGDSTLTFQVRPEAGQLDFKHPQFPDTLRVGGNTLMTVSGPFTFSINYSTTGCSFSGGPWTFMFGPFAGFMMTNPFPELRTEDSDLRDWLKYPARSYVAAASDQTMVTVNVSGVGCSPTQPDITGGMLLTNDANSGLYINPPVVMPNGQFKGAFQTSDARFKWDLQPQPEP